jgi:CBS domain-containing protein
MVAESKEWGMKVREIMTTAPEACRPDTNLAAAVERLWAADCGILPVTDEALRPIGVVTDRDICIALGTRNRQASSITVDSVMRQRVETCGVDEDVTRALGRMKERRVRRLPVVDREGKLAGILSMNDVVLATGPSARAIKPAVVVETLKAICSHDVPAVRDNNVDAASSGSGTPPGFAAAISRVR